MNFYSINSISKEFLFKMENVSIFSPKGTLSYIPNSQSDWVLLSIENFVFFSSLYSITETSVSPQSVCKFQEENADILQTCNLSYFRVVNKYNQSCNKRKPISISPDVSFPYRWYYTLTFNFIAFCQPLKMYKSSYHLVHRDF